MGGGVLWYVLNFLKNITDNSLLLLLCCLAFGEIEGEFDE